MNPQLGALLNVVPGGWGAWHQCPSCGAQVDLWVYEEAALFTCCGFIRPLPPLPAKPRHLRSVPPARPAAA